MYYVIWSLAPSGQKKSYRPESQMSTRVMFKRADLLVKSSSIDPVCRYTNILTSYLVSSVGGWKTNLGLVTRVL